MTALSLAIDLGGTEVRAALVTAEGTLLVRGSERTDVAGGPAAVVAQMVRLVQRVAADAAGQAIVGLGVGAPGPLDPERGVVLFAPTLGDWHDVPLAALLQDRLGHPVRLDNDANLAALAEWQFGAGRGTRSMVFVTVSTGIGGGVIADGRLLRGHRGLAAEVGHMTVADDRVACVCGSTGCWEAMASGWALARIANAAVASGAESAMRRDGTLSARDVAEASVAGDRLAQRLMDDEAAWLGRGFANLLHLYDPERIVVGGGLSMHLETMRPRIMAVMHARSMAAYHGVPVTAAMLGGDAGLVGAGWLALQAAGAA